LRVFQGASFAQDVVWTVDDAVAGASYAARMQVRASVSSEDVLLDMSEGERLSVVSETGVITLSMSLTAEETAALEWTSGVYDLEIEAEDGFVTRLLSGTVTVSPEVTR
jgi:hypothetical protein